MTMMIVIFWLFLFLIIYCYFGYPVAISLVAKLRVRPVRKEAILPTVSLVISVWNEEDVIEGKIKNLLSLDYPPEKLEILIGSDNSTDKTNEIIGRSANDRLRLVESRERRGKMFMLNDLVWQAKNEIVVFTDARQSFARDAIKQLVANFADPAVGCVSGELMFSSKDGGTAKGINLYWNYEKFIRKQESQVHSMLGATGAIYAIRRELFAHIPGRVVLDDMFVPFKIIEKGFRAVFDGTAHAYDEVADSPQEEHRRKARTLYGNYQIFGLLPQMFNPFKSPIALQLFSHKFLRVVAPFLLIAIFLVNFFLAGQPLYKILFILQIIFYAMAVTGGLARHKKYGILRLVSKVCYVPYVFCLLNFSALVGFFRFLGAKQEVGWEKARKKE
jgi:biofilm PGA synthesis N-glycosyltransferase PgaC